MFSALTTAVSTFTAAGLRNLTVQKVGDSLQVSAENPMAGLEGRAQLLLNLAKALEASPQIFGEGPTARPGNLLGESFPNPSSKQSAFN